MISAVARARILLATIAPFIAATIVVAPASAAGSNMMFHRTRRLLIRHHIATINSIRSHLAIGAPRKRGVELLLQVLADSNDARLPKMARACIAALAVQSRELKSQILELKRWQRQA